jgi:hypothetical protein
MVDLSELISLLLRKHTTLPLGSIREKGSLVVSYKQLDLDGADDR